MIPPEESSECNHQKKGHVDPEKNEPNNSPENDIDVKEKGAKKKVHFSSEIPPEDEDREYMPRRSSIVGDTKVNLPFLERYSASSPLFHLISVFRGTVLYFVASCLLLSLLPAFTTSFILRGIVRVVLKLFYRDIHLVEAGVESMAACESPTSSSNIVLALKCEGLPLLEPIREIFEKKVLGFRTDLKFSSNKREPYEPFDKLRLTLIEKFGFFCWKRQRHFSIRNHVLLDELGEKEPLEERVEELAEFYLGTKLSPVKPQWEVRIVTRRNNGVGSIPSYYLVLAIHHSYGDALSILQMIRYGLADKPFKCTLEPMAQNSENKKISFWRSLTFAPWVFIRSVVDMLQEGNAFHGPLANGVKTCKWSSKMTLKQFKGVRVDTEEGCQRASFTSVLCACLTQAIARSFSDARARIPQGVITGVPFARLPFKDLKLANKFSLSLLRMPTGETCRRDRLDLCQERCQSASDARLCESNRILSQLCGSLINPIMRKMGLVLRSTVAISNVPGPREKFTIFGGHLVLDLVLFPPMKYRTALVVGVVSYCDKVSVSFGADEVILRRSPKFPYKFLRYIELELDALVGEDDNATPTPMKIQSPFVNRKLPEINPSFIMDEEDKENRKTEEISLNIGNIGLESNLDIKGNELLMEEDLKSDLGTIIKEVYYV